MNNPDRIFLLPIIILGLVIVLTRFHWITTTGRRAARFCQIPWNTFLRLLAVRIPPDRCWFNAGAMGGVLLDWVCTLTNHWHRGGLDSIGFPFFLPSPIYFSWWALLIDVFVLGLFALFGGYAAIGARRLWLDGSNSPLK